MTFTIPSETLAFALGWVFGVVSIVLVANLVAHRSASKKESK